MYKNLLLSLLVLVLYGCGTQPLKVDLSQSIYVKPVSNTNKPKLRAITFINKAENGKTINTILGSDSVFPMRLKKPTKETVEKDIRRYFQERTISSNETPTSLNIVIYKADSYRIWGGAAKIPIIGLVLINADTEFGINLKLSFEIVEKGKVVRAYWFDDVITIQAKAATQESLKKSYEQLVRKYRKILFGQLDSEFFGRYM